MTRRTRSFSLATLALHGGREPAAGKTPVATPLVQAVGFAQDVGTGDELPSPRHGHVPNAEIVQERLALLEGAEAAVVLASGMAATACALLALLRPGDHLLASAWLYGGTRALLLGELATMGIEVTLVDPTETREWRRRMRKETRAIFLETPVDPTCRVLDLRPISYLTQEIGLALVVDSTYATPMALRPLEHGADVVIHSASKYLNGHNDVLAGAVLGTASYIEEVRRKMTTWGQAPDPFACWLLERGLKTLDVRVRRQSETAMRVAEWCAARPDIRRVRYPGLPDHPDHAVAREILDRFGGMLALELADGPRAAERMLRRLRLIQHAPGLGGVDSNVSEPRLSSHASLAPEERHALGIPDGLLRFSLGLEDPDDLIADLAQALG